MLKQVLLHIGMHKTGTSSLQRYWNNINRTPSSPFNYLKCGRNNGQDDAHHQLLDLVKKGDLSILRELCNEAENSDKCIQVISCEDFSRPQNILAVKRIIDAVSQFEIRIKCIIRRHDQWFHSYYSEEVVRGRTELLPNDFLNNFSWLMEYNRNIEMMSGFYGCDIDVIQYNNNKNIREVTEGIIGFPIEFEVSDIYINRRVRPIVAAVALNFSMAGKRLSSRAIDYFLAAWDQLPAEQQAKFDMYNSLFTARFLGRIYDITSFDRLRCEERFNSLQSGWWLPPEREEDFVCPTADAVTSFLHAVIENQSVSKIFEQNRQIFE